MKKTPLAKKAKSKSRGWYNAKLDTIAKTFAKERDNYICQYSGQSVEGVNAHGSHVVPVSAGNVLRWDLNNIKCLSYHNHINGWHKNPLEYAEWFKTDFPERYEYLEKRRYMEIKITQGQLVEFYQKALRCKDWREYQLIYDVCFKEWCFK